MLIASKQVVMLYIMALVGAVADKTGVFTEKTAKKCTDLLFYIVTPAKIIESFLNLEYSDRALRGLFIAIGMGLLFHLIGYFVVMPFFNKSPADDAAVFKYAAMYGNCGYMGLPLVDAVLGSEGVFYCSAVIISFQIFTFTGGIRLINYGKKDRPKINIKNIIINPGVLPVFIGLPLFILKVKMPEVISSPISSLASLNSPLAMLIFGTYIANTDFRLLFKEWKIWGVGAIKLIILPAIMIGLSCLFGINGTLFCTLALCAATPPANNTVMFSAKYDRSTSLASLVVAAVSLLSIVTLPAIIALTKGMC